MTLALEDNAVQTLRSPKFWAWFNDFAAPNLDIREPTFRKMFEYLDLVYHPFIIETGCMRHEGWSDGRSTQLFAKYLECQDGGHLVSIDISPENVEFARQYVNEFVSLRCMDSVQAIREMYVVADLVYLDSFDYDRSDPMPSVVHHCAELVAGLQNVVGAKTLVVVDDSPIINNRVAGKGALIADLATKFGAKRIFASYQVGWVGFN